ncbi:MAG TPA: aminodeoxychorismate/anthranilate synthase component II [Candidatus Wirthbacteria bacterium]|nr:aminodeoxychorismate/anthranilate synthase component II [Candidatus Wirthbacteria bacterium]
MKTVIIDNYDSFTYNLYQYIGELGGNPSVHRNDKVTLEMLREDKPTHIIISPGPGDPRDADYFGVCADVITQLGQTIPLLGVCLGHQGIGHLFGGQIIRAPQIRHGKTSLIKHNAEGVFHNISNPCQGMRYHSLIIDEHGFPDCLEITAREVSEGIIMGIRHKQYPIYGIQFHPESIGTLQGKCILNNFLDIKS